MTRLRVLVALCATAAVAACTSSTSGTGSASTTPASSSSAASSTSSSASSAGSSAGSSAAGSSSSAAPVSPAACTGAQIKVTSTPPPGGAAAGHVGLVLLFDNISSTTCVLTGYPGVDGLDAGGHSVASATRTLNGMIGFCGCTKPAVLTLGPGVVVSAVAEGTSAGSGGLPSCAAFPALLVTPPNTTVSTTIPASPYSCDFTVHPVVTGLAGQSGTP